MIAALFTLSGMLLFMLAVMVTDAWRGLAREIEEADRCFGHDINIYPDYEP